MCNAVKMLVNTKNPGAACATERFTVKCNGGPWVFVPRLDAVNVVRSKRRTARQ